MAARLTKWTPEVVRKRIQTAHIVTVLQKHIRGKLELSNTQVRAAEVLLRKTLPDQSAITYSGEDLLRSARDFTTAELDQRIRALEGKESAPASEPVAPELH